MSLFYNEEKREVKIVSAIIGAVAGIFIILIAFIGFGFLNRSYGRYQVRKDAQNEVAVNEIRIHQQEQLIQVEKQKAEIRIQEAKGIAEAQSLINKSLTDKYLQHEAIKAQEKMAGSPNHTQIYIPVGQNGIPIVKTLE